MFSISHPLNINISCESKFQVDKKYGISSSFAGAPCKTEVSQLTPVPVPHSPQEMRKNGINKLGLGPVASTWGASVEHGSMWIRTLEKITLSLKN